MKEHYQAVWRAKDGDLMLSSTLFENEEEARFALGAMFVALLPNPVITEKSKEEHKRRTDWRER